MKSISALAVSLLLLSATTAKPEHPIDIGDRRELCTDDTWIGSVAGKAEWRLHHPTPREVAMRYDRPWEGNASGYPTIIRDGDLYRMWYRGHRYLLDDKPLRQAQPECVCYAESRDGITWEKPSLGLFSWNGSKENNIVWMGDAATHNFAPFKDANPACPPEQRYKAIGGTVASHGLLAFQSADGIRWSRLRDQPVVNKGAFDSHNTAFWDPVQHRYSMYVRYFSEDNFKGLRSIGVAHSSDFLTWSEPVGLSYPQSPPQQMYTNQVGPYHRAPHILLGFPTRYVARPMTEHARHLEPVETRAKFARSVSGTGSYTGAEVTEGVFMSSRDGITFRRWDEAFLRPGPQARGRWIYGDNYQSYGLWETKSEIPGAPHELSMHFNEGAWNDELHCVRRYTIRLDGFVSFHAPLAGGEIVTRPLKFTGRRLTVNYSTSAAGSLLVELQDEQGRPISGFALAESTEHFGDTIEQIVSWTGGSDVSAISRKPVRLRFVLKDADLFSFRFVDP